MPRIDLKQVQVSILLPSAQIDIDIDSLPKGPSTTAHVKVAIRERITPYLLPTPQYIYPNKHFISHNETKVFRNNWIAANGSKVNVQEGEEFQMKWLAPTYGIKSTKKPPTHIVNPQ